MVIIAGLGNPGRQYAGTRHNIGFEVIDELADRYGIRVLEHRHKALVGKGRINGIPVLLVKPVTYMNLSGESVRDAVDYYKVDPARELIVICDDINLDVGQLRIRKKGSAGGHNGLKSIIAMLGTQEFPRIRIGVGDKPEGRDLANYVLGHFDRSERDIIEKSRQLAADAVLMMLSDGPDAAMNQYNGRRQEKQADGPDTAMNRYNGKQQGNQADGV